MPDSPRGNTAQEQLWRIEYSQLCDERGTYPWHFEPASRCHPSFDGDDWCTVFIGKHDAGCEKLDELVKRWQSEKKTKRAKSKERDKMTPTLRYRVLERDGFRCVLCGRDQSSGAVLHVDHIIPIAKGGPTKIENLRALCSDCNHGKGAR